MSTPGTPPAQPVKPKRGLALPSLFRVRAQPGEMVLISHSTMFYWWPVWLCGFIMAGITYFHDTHVVFVPGKTQLVKVKSAELPNGQQLTAAEMHAVIP